MSQNSNYNSKKVLKKAVFSIAFQVVPIALALILTPILIQDMGKDFWAKYSTGISIIFLSNYFSFGIGPALNRRVSEIIGSKNYRSITEQFKSCLSISYLLGLFFFLILQLALFLAFQSQEFSILKSLEDYYFYVIVVFNFLLVLIIIPYRSLLESFSDFYFLAIVRAITAVSLFVTPFVIISLLDHLSLIVVGLSLLIFYLVLYVIFYIRVRTFANTYAFSLFSPLSKSLIKSVLEFDLGFLKETYYFSIFFISSALVLFFDRFYYPLFYDTTLISDHVTLMDLFNRVAIVTGTLSLVYFSAISVWYQEKDLTKIRKNIIRQFVIVLFIFSLIIFISYFFLSDILSWWLNENYSTYIQESAFLLLLSVLLINFTILMIRPLQAIGYVKQSSLWLLSSTIIYVFIVIGLGVLNKIEYHFMALLVKATIDILVFSVLMRKKSIL